MLYISGSDRYSVSVVVIEVTVDADAGGNPDQLNRLAIIIAGSVVGLLLLIALIVVIVILCRRHKRRKYSVICW